MRKTSRYELLNTRIDVDRLQDVQRIGDEGWELIEMEGRFAVRFRRLTRIKTAGWQYRRFAGFSAHAAAWHKYLNRCGWSFVHGTASSRLYGTPISCSVAKRPSELAATDDGDISSRLEASGCAAYADCERAICEILAHPRESKLSEGSARAARWWLAHRFVPLLIEQHGLDLPPQSERSAIFEEIMALRSSLTEGEILPDLRTTVDRWCRWKSPVL